MFSQDRIKKTPRTMSVIAVLLFTQNLLVTEIAFMGKSGHLTAFPRGCSKINRVLEQSHSKKKTTPGAL
jgi:hypothetical protein